MRQPCRDPLADGAALIAVSKWTLNVTRRGESLLHTERRVEAQRYQLRASERPPETIDPSNLHR